MKREYLYIGIILIALGTVVFTSVSNRALRRESRALKQQNKYLHVKNDSLKSELKLSQEKINEGTVIYDSLKSTLEYLNNKKIVTVNENIRTVSTLDLDGQIELLSGFIEGNDSAR